MKLNSLIKSVVALFLLLMILLSFGGRIFYEVKDHNHQCNKEHCSFCTFNEYTKNNYRKMVFMEALAAYFLLCVLRSFPFLSFYTGKGEKNKTLTELKVRLNN